MLALLSSNPARGNVSGHHRLLALLRSPQNHRKQIKHLIYLPSLLQTKPCRWPFVINPSVLESQQSITTNGQKSTLDYQIISHTLQVCLSALKLLPFQMHADKRTSINAVTTVAIVFSCFQSAYRRYGTNQGKNKSFPFGFKCSSGFWNQIKWSLVKATAMFPLYLFIHLLVPPGPLYALHSERWASIFADNSHSWSERSAWIYSRNTVREKNSNGDIMVLKVKAITLTGWVYRWAAWCDHVQICLKKWIQQTFRGS